eukprot:CAMPEP_0206806422 /NCGR_PEP_ID=MMETSP0975-20121206/4722_1 /ASSEMBLY_ACC=CAM_ASM_000399 /TAXON_ID=483370 /ORGANISM="non described non described, Strain CCMP2097" /LENGTH=134 /DNA_ID=CAMNT_0054348489 /DNA_START=159 /DNA_END=559 /DNA_ORIENTATION=+
MKDYFGLETAVFGPTWRRSGRGPEMGSRRSACAIVFAGGRVVVFGGDLNGTNLNTAELLDMQTMTFIAGPNMLTARSCCAAVQIDVDRSYDGAPLNTTEIFNLLTLTSTPGPDMQSPRRGCAAVALDARRIVVV